MKPKTTVRVSPYIFSLNFFLLQKLTSLESCLCVHVISVCVILSLKRDGWVGVLVGWLGTVGGTFSKTFSIVRR